MTSGTEYDEAFVWIWLPGATAPVVAGRLARTPDQQFVFNYGRSYLARPNATPIYEPELPLQPGVLPLLNGLAMPSSLRDAAPDAWGRRVIINRKLGTRGSAIDTTELNEIAFLLEISPGTVKKHLENIYTKLGVENRHAAALVAVRLLL